MSKAFTTFNTQMKILEESDSNLSDYEDEYEASHFQIADIDFCKVTSDFHIWTRNSNLAS